MSYDKLARFDARKTIGAAKDAVKGYAGNVSGGRYRKLQQQASALEGELGQLLNVPKMNPKRGAKIKELRDAITGMNPEIVAAKKARNLARAGTGGALGLAGGGIAMSKTEKKANYIGGEPAGGYQMGRPITDLLKEAAIGKAITRGAKTYWGNLSGKAYRAARTASESAASIYGKPNQKLVNNLAKAKRARNLTRAGTGVVMGAAVAEGVGLKNNLKTAGFDKQAEPLLSGIIGSEAAAQLSPAEADELRGYHGLKPKGGLKSRGYGRSFIRGLAGGVGGGISGAALGAGIGAVTRNPRLGANLGGSLSSIGGIGGAIAGGIAGAKKYSRKGLEEQRRIHGVKTAGDIGNYMLGGGIGLKNNLEKSAASAPLMGGPLMAGIIGSEAASKLSPAEADELRGYYGLKPKGGLKSRGYGRSYIRGLAGGVGGSIAGAALGAGIGVAARNPLLGAQIGSGVGTVGGMVAGGVHGAKKYSRKGLEEMRARHGVKTAGAKELFRKGRQFGGTVLNDLTGKTYRRASGLAGKLDTQMTQAFDMGQFDRGQSLMGRSRRVWDAADKALSNMRKARIAAGGLAATGGTAVGVSQARKTRAAEPEA